MLAFYAQFLKEGDLCFDVGANVGNRTAVFADIGARVIAVEPQEACVAVLQKRFERRPAVTVVRTALGEKPGTQEMLMSEVSTIASMSKEWIERVRSSGRFAEYHWDKTVTVTVTTLDALIARFGVPAFIKIDVEGYERYVLQGLTRPVEMLSIEFVPELLENTVACLTHLEQLGPIVANYSVGESMEWALQDWVSAATLLDILRSISDPSVFGDVYVRFLPTQNMGAA
jgi:FkbM family methyltransferase